MDAAESGDHDNAERGIACDAEHDFDAAGRHFLHEHAVEPGFRLVAARRRHDFVERARHLRIAGYVEPNRVGFSFMRNVRRLDF